MFKFSKSSANYRRFRYYPRRYDEKAEKLEAKRSKLNFLSEKENFDLIDYHLKKQKRETFSAAPLLLGIVFLVVLIFSQKINFYLSSNYKHGEFGIYFLLILLGLLFIKTSKKRKNARHN
jgi:hypothetical protein